MAITTYPLNDIEYTAEDAELYNCTRNSGVYSGSDFTCTVNGTNNNVVIGEGVGWIRNGRFAGKVFANREAETIALDVADDVYPRIDVVGVRYETATNRTDIVVKKGTASANPVMPDIVQTETVYELYFYSVYREAAATVITADNVTDLRLDANYCGLMGDAITSIDTSAINEQFSALLAKIKKELADLKIGKIDAYSREETLSPTTKTLFGLGEDAVPDDAFASLELHWWKTRALEQGVAEVTDNAKVLYLAYYQLGTISGYTPTTFYVGDSYTLNEDGTFTINGATAIKTAAEYLDNPTKLNEVFAGKYFATSGEVNQEYIYTTGILTSSNLTSEQTGTASEINVSYHMSCTKISSEPITTVGAVKYVSSTNRHEYPDSGRQGIFTYEYLGSPLENAKEAYGMRQHWWKRRTEESGYSIAQETINKFRVFEQQAGTTSATINRVYYSDTITLNEEGQIILDNPTTMTTKYDANTIAALSALTGKYYKVQSNAASGICYFGSEDISATAGLGTVTEAGYTYYALTVYNQTKIYAKRYENIGEYEYVSSPNRNAYPDSGTEGIFSYQYLAVPFENAREGTKIVTGSYVGTGTSGSSNPNTLTFGFRPKIVLFQRESAVACGIYVWGCENLLRIASGSGYANTATTNENTLTWYGSSSSNQLNDATYFYLAIG